MTKRKAKTSPGQVKVDAAEDVGTVVRTASGQRYGQEPITWWDSPATARTYLMGRAREAIRTARHCVEVMREPDDERLTPEQNDANRRGAAHDALWWLWRAATFREFAQRQTVACSKCHGTRVAGYVFPAGVVPTVMPCEACR